MQARDWGLIWETCEPAALLPRALEVATSLATQPTRGFGLTKQAFNESLMNDLDAQLDLEADLQAEAGRTKDFAEGVAAFRAKRSPRVPRPMMTVGVVGAGAMGSGIAQVALRTWARGGAGGRGEGRGPARARTHRGRTGA